MRDLVHKIQIEEVSPPWIWPKNQGKKKLWNACQESRTDNYPFKIEQGDARDNAYTVQTMLIQELIIPL